MFSKCVRRADECFRAHGWGLKIFSNFSGPIGWGCKIDRNSSSLLEWVSSQSFRFSSFLEWVSLGSFRGADGCSGPTRIDRNLFGFLKRVYAQSFRGADKCFKADQVCLKIDGNPSSL